MGASRLHNRLEKLRGARCTPLHTNTSRGTTHPNSQFPAHMRTRLGQVILVDTVEDASRAAGYAREGDPRGTTKRARPTKVVMATGCPR